MNLPLPALAIIPIEARGFLARFDIKPFVLSFSRLALHHHFPLKKGVLQTPQTKKRLPNQIGSPIISYAYSSSY
jgi:hypothetical protein